MAIDLKTETIIDALRQVPLLLGPGRGGKPRHKSFVVRAIKKGCNGRRLEALKVGSGWITSVEAVQRWVEGQTPGLPGEAGGRPTAGRLASERAGRELDRLGF